MKVGYVLALLAVAVIPASADLDLYSNGPINGNFDAFGIGGVGVSVSDSFVLTSASTVTGVDFGAWTYDFADKSVTSVQWSIGTTPGDLSLGTGTADTTDTFFGTSTNTLFGAGVFTVDSDSFSTGNISLGAGAYYLTLQNAVTAPVNTQAYWDVNNGPSSAFYNADSPNPIPFANYEVVCTTCSEAFDIQGTTGTVTPEPDSYAVLILGFGGVILAVRSRRSKQHR